MQKNLVRSQYAILDAPGREESGELGLDCSMVDSDKGVEWMLKGGEDMLDAFL